MAITDKRERKFDGSFLRIYTGNTAKGAPVIHLVIRNTQTNGKSSWSELSAQKTGELANELLNAAYAMGAEPRTVTVPAPAEGDPASALAKIAQLDVSAILAKMRS